MSKSIIIVGSGIMGAMCAHNFLREDPQLDIRVVSKSFGTDKQCATNGTWGWINANTDNDEHYHTFRKQSMKLWHELGQDIQQIPLSQTNSLIYDLSYNDLSSTVNLHHSWGYPISLIERKDILKIAPYIQNPPKYAAYVENELTLNATVASEILIQSSGAQCISTDVFGLTNDTPNKITGIMTSNGPLSADEIILCAGHGIPPLLKSIGIQFQLNATKGLIAYTEPMQQFLPHLHMGPDFHVRQDKNGQLIIGAAGDTNYSDASENLDALTTSLCTSVSQALECPSHPKTKAITFADRVLTVDGLPKIGRPTGLKGLYAMAMHGGISNAPLAAHIAVQEILYDNRPQIAAPYPFSGTELAQEL